MTQKREPLVVTMDQMGVLFEIYLSGFTSGAASFGASFNPNVDPARIAEVAHDMATSICASPATMAEVVTIIEGCLNDEDVVEKWGVVENVNYRS